MSKIDSVLQSGLLGMQRGLSGVAEKADKLSKAFLPESQEDPISYIVGMKIDELTFKASAKVAQTSDQLSETALSLLA